MACGRGCRDNLDIRCCCEPGCPKKNTIKQFNNCPKKLDTLYFHLTNDYRTYERIELIDEIDIKSVRELVKMIHRGIQLNSMECLDLCEMINNEKEDYDDYCLSLH